MKNRSKYLLVLALIGLAFMAFRTGKNLKEKKHTTIAKPAWKTGVALYSFNQHPFTTALEMADSTGTKLIEGFSFYKLGDAFNNNTMGNLNKADIARIKQMMAAKGISMPSMYVDGAKNLAGWKKVFEMGNEFDVKVFVCEPEKRQLPMVDSLAGIYKIKVAIHEHEQPDIYCDPDSLMKFIKGFKNIGACADIGHWVRSGFDPVKSLQKLRGHLIELHIHDIDKAKRDVDLGTGIIDFPAVMKELKQQRFNGIMFLEIEHSMRSNMKNVKSGLKYLDDIAAKN